MKIEVGKKYLTREGGIAIIIENDGSDYAPFLANVDDKYITWYYEDGFVARPKLDKPHRFDIVSEYIKPPTNAE